MSRNFRAQSEMQIFHRVFLQSEAWREIRHLAFKHHGDLCLRCGEPANDIHHKTYVRWGGREQMEDLEPLCRKCHSEHHIQERREKKATEPIRKQKTGKKKKKPSPKRRHPPIHYRNALAKLSTAEQAQIQDRWPGRMLSILIRERSQDGDGCRKMMAKILNCEDVVLDLDFRKWQPNARKKKKK